MTTRIPAVLLALTLSLAACNEDTAPPDTAPPAEPGPWVAAECTREHRTVTIQRDARGRVEARETRVFAFEDVPAATDVQTCEGGITGCSGTLPYNDSCTGDLTGPWPLCTVSAAPLTPDGAGVASCGYTLTRETFGADGTPTSAPMTTSHRLSVATRAR